MQWTSELKNFCSCFKYWSFSNKVFLKIKSLKKKKKKKTENSLRKYVEIDYERFQGLCSHEKLVQIHDYI